MIVQKVMFLYIPMYLVYPSALITIQSSFNLFQTMVHTVAVIITLLIKLASLTLGISVNSYLLLKSILKADFRRIYPLEVNIVVIGVIFCGLYIPMTWFSRLSLLFPFVIDFKFCLVVLFFRILSWSNMCITIFFISIHRLNRVRQRIAVVRPSVTHLIEVSAAWVLSFLLSSLHVASYSQTWTDDFHNQSYFGEGCVVVTSSFSTLFHESILVLLYSIMLIAIIICWLGILLAIRFRHQVQPLESLSFAITRHPTIRKGVTSISDTVIKISIPGFIHEETRHESEFDIEIKSNESDILRLNSFDSEESLANAFEGSYTESLRTQTDEQGLSDVSDFSGPTRLFRRTFNHSPNPRHSQKCSERENPYPNAWDSRRKSSPRLRRCRFSRSHSDMNPSQIRKLMKKLHEHTDLSPKKKFTSLTCREKRNSFKQSRKHSSKFRFTQEMVSSKCSFDGKQKSKVLQRSHSSGDFWSKAENFKLHESDLSLNNFRSKHTTLSTSNDGYHCSKTSSTDSKQISSSDKSSSGIRSVCKRTTLASYSDTKTTPSHDGCFPPSPGECRLKTRRRTNVTNLTSWSELSNHSRDSPTDIYVMKRKRKNLASFSDSKSILSSERFSSTCTETPADRCPKDRGLYTRQKIKKRSESNRQSSIDSRTCVCCEKRREMPELIRPETSLSLSSGLELHLPEKGLNKSYEEKESYTETSLSLHSLSTTEIEDINNTEKFMATQKIGGIFLSPEIPEYKFSNTSFTPSEKVKFWKQKIIEDLDEDEDDFAVDETSVSKSSQGKNPEVPVEIKIIRPSTAGNQIVSRRNAFMEEYPIVEHIQMANRTNQQCVCDRRRIPSTHTPVSASDSVSRRMLLALILAILMFPYTLLLLINISTSSDVTEMLEFAALLVELVFALKSYLYVLYNRNIMKLLTRKPRHALVRN